MSIVALARVMDHSTAKLGARLVLFVLAEHAHDDGSNAYPSVDTMTSRTRMSRRAVQAALRRLEAEGEIVRDGVARSGTTQYRLTFAGGAESAPPPSGAESAPGGRSSRHAGGEAATPEPSVKPDVSGSNDPSTSGRAGAREGKVDLPDEFPDELRDHLKAVYRVLRDLAQRESANVVQPHALAYAVMANPLKPLVAAAHDCASHWAGRGPKDVVACYRNWLKRTPDLAAPERLDRPRATNGRQRMNPDRPASDEQAEILRRFHQREAAHAQPTTEGSSTA